jgi:flagellar hook-associated protein 3 FlgL
MIANGLGDRAQLFTGMRHNTDIRNRLGTLQKEISTGFAADMVAHLKGDTAPLAEIDRRLALASSYGSAAKEAGQRLAAMESSLQTMETTRAKVLKELMAPSADGNRTVAATASRGAFDDVAVALNARWGDGSLFAGTDTGGPALASASDMFAEIRNAVAGATTAEDVRDALDTWFDDPAGGFATMGYLGNDTDLTRAVDDGATVTLAARADNQAFRGLLKAAAMGALAADPALALPESEAHKLVGLARDGILSSTVPLTNIRADIGQAQARAEEAAARHAARGTAWGIIRNEMTLSDPYANASEIETLRTRLETHYQITGRLGTLNLVNYLR